MKSSGELDLLVAVGVHEYELFGLPIEELEILALDMRLFDAFVGAEALVELAPVHQVLQLDLIVGRPLRASRQPPSRRSIATRHAR